MKAYIETRVLEIASYMINTNCTIRQAAKKFGVCKTTAQKDLEIRLLEVKPELVLPVRKVLDKNLLERNVRGGQAKANKYKFDIS